MLAALGRRAGSPGYVLQEDHVTPPPSPFAPFAAKDSDASVDVQLVEEAIAEPSEAVVPTQKAWRNDASRAVPVFANGSLSLPQTPSAASEGLVGPSRNGSIISASAAADVSQLKGQLRKDGKLLDRRAD